MLKPSEYRDQYVVTKDMPYWKKDVTQRGPQATSGLLETGRVVYLSPEARKSEEDREIAAYADGIGLLLLNARWINRTS